MTTLPRNIDLAEGLRRRRGTGCIVSGSIDVRPSSAWYPNALASLPGFACSAAGSASHSDFQAQITAGP